MIKDLNHIRYRRFIFSVNDSFLNTSIDLSADINYFIQCPQNLKQKLKEFYTLLIDLSKPVEDIRGDIYHRTLTEINSFVSNQDFEHQLLFNLSETELKTFIDLFDSFAAKKNIRRAERFRLKAYNQKGILAVTFIKQNNNYSFINFYRVTKDRATNLSSFRPEEKTETSTSTSNTGRAHRALHWLDILEFKKLEIKFYDFGGWYEGESDHTLLNINKFKEQFTKLKVKEYTGVIYKNPFLIFLSKWKK